MTWSIHRLISVMQHQAVEDLLKPYNDIPGIHIIDQEHNYSFSSDSSLKSSACRLVLPVG